MGGVGGWDGGGVKGWGGLVTPSVALPIWLATSAQAKRLKNMTQITKKQPQKYRGQNRWGQNIEPKCHRCSLLHTITPKRCVPLRSLFLKGLSGRSPAQMSQEKHTVTQKRCVPLRNLFLKGLSGRSPAQVSQEKLATHSYFKETPSPKESLFEKSVWAKPSPGVIGEACYAQLA